ncbi:MAG: hypothetical protein BMS9Abin15_0489 [Gammaproteobacteria bacterium]|nr:MAG: hypothetical protein BMS9Abin15_0489 [Gammaproteobacteria bacterium]
MVHPAHQHLARSFDHSTKRRIGAFTFFLDGRLDNLPRVASHHK